MRTASPRVVKYKGSETSKFVVEGLRVAGKRTRKFFGTRRAGEAWLRKTSARMTKEGESAIHMPEQLRVEAVACADRLKPYSRTLTDATDHLIAHLETVQRSCTVSTFFPTFLANKKADGASAEYLQDLKNRLERFEVTFGARNIAEIQPVEVDDWLRDLGLSAQSRKNFRTVLKTFFGAAVDAQYAQQNPVSKKKIKIIQGEVGIFTPAQLRTMLEKAPRDFLPVLLIGGLAGLRPSEIERLDWANIDLAQRLIDVKGKNSKTAQTRLVTVTDNLAAWLAPLAKKSGPVVDPERVIVARRKLCTDTAIPWPHDGLRHSYGTYHLAQFKNAATTAVEMGHGSTRMIYKHYRKIVKPEDAAQWWQIVPPADYGNIVAFTGTVG